MSSDKPQYTAGPGRQAETGLRPPRRLTKGLAASQKASPPHKKPRRPTKSLAAPEKASPPHKKPRRLTVAAGPHSLTGPASLTAGRTSDSDRGHGYLSESDDAQRRHGLTTCTFVGSTRSWSLKIRQTFPSESLTLSHVRVSLTLSHVRVSLTLSPVSFLCIGPSHISLLATKAFSSARVLSNMCQTRPQGASDPLSRLPASAPPHMHANTRKHAGVCVRSTQRAHRAHRALAYKARTGRRGRRRPGSPPVSCRLSPCRRCPPTSSGTPAHRGTQQYGSRAQTRPKAMRSVRPGRRALQHRQADILMKPTPT